MRLAATITLLLVTAIAAGCGGGVNASDRAAITQATARGLNGTPDEQCRTAATPRLITALYGSPARCRRIATQAGSHPDTQIHVQDISGTAPDVQVKITLIGGTLAGTAGHLTLRRSPAGSWQIDELRLDLLRSLLTDAAGAHDAHIRRSRLCLSKLSRTLSDAAFRRLAYAMIGARQPAFSRQVNRCFPPLGGSAH